MKATNLDQKQWQLGKTKIFIRHPESLFFLEECLERHDYEKAALIQKAWRRWKGKKKVSKYIYIMKTKTKNQKAKKTSVGKIPRNKNSPCFLSGTSWTHPTKFSKTIAANFFFFFVRMQALEQRALAANLLRGKKERRRESVSKKFDADYVRYDNNFGLQAAIVRYSTLRQKKKKKNRKTFSVDLSDEN